MSKRMSQRAVPALCWLLGAASPLLYGQVSSSKPVEKEEPGGFRRLSFGGRFAGYPFNPFHNKEVKTTPGNSTVSYDFNTTNNYRKTGYGPSVELRITHKFSLNGELLFHGVNYTKTTIITDTLAGNTGITENTWATFWDIPIMVRYRGLGKASKLFVAGGPEIRNATHIRSSIETDLPDGAISTSTQPITPAKRKVLGAVVGMGLRLVDDFNFKVTPEIRYTRWIGSTFDSDSTHSSRNQLELSIGLTF